MQLGGDDCQGPTVLAEPPDGAIDVAAGLVFVAEERLGLKPRGKAGLSRGKDDRFRTGPHDGEPRLGDVWLGLRFLSL